MIRPSGPTTERAPPWPLLCSLVLEVPPLFSQPLSSLSRVSSRGLCLSVCFVCETTGHGTSTTFRGRRVDPAFGPLRSARGAVVCAAAGCCVALWRCWALGVVCVVGEGTTPWGREPALLNVVRRRVVLCRSLSRAYSSTLNRNFRRLQ